MAVDDQEGELYIVEQSDDGTSFFRVLSTRTHHLLREFRIPNGDYRAIAIFDNYAYLTSLLPRDAVIVVNKVDGTYVAEFSDSVVLPTGGIVVDQEKLFVAGHLDHSLACFSRSSNTSPIFLRRETDHFDDSAWGTCFLLTSDGLHLFTLNADTKVVEMITKEGQNVTSWLVPHNGSSLNFFYGYLYIGDDVLRRVHVYTPQGVLVDTFPLPDVSSYGPPQMAFSSTSGGTVYAIVPVAPENSASYRIEVFS
jgi:hypothetical protein